MRAGLSCHMHTGCHMITHVVVDWECLERVHRHNDISDVAVDEVLVVHIRDVLNHLHHRNVRAYRVIS